MPVTEGQDFLEAMRKTGQQLTTGKAVRFHITVSGTGRQAHVTLQQNPVENCSRKSASRNAIHHGRAKNFDVHITYLNPDGMRLQIRDDGCGFDLEEASEKLGHWGLATMRERAQRIGAEFNITTAPGRGSEIEIFIPVESIKS